jgi:peptide/nickel transport system substrate-binding protein
VPKYPYDPARAKALLKEAGVPSFKFVITSIGLFPYDKMVVPLASDLNEVGIETTSRYSSAAPIPRRARRAMS